MTYTAQLGVAAGSGLLARRGRTCLFIPSPQDDTASPTELVAAFIGAPNDVEAAVVDFVLAHPESAPAFVLAVWPAAASGEGIQLMVRGDLTVDTDIASAPSLNGAGSTTWAEHRVRYNPGEASVSTGTDVNDVTDLADGVVPAGGFRLVLVDAGAVAPTGATVRPVTDAETDGPAIVTTAAPHADHQLADEPEPATVVPHAAAASDTPTTAPSGVPRSGLDALRAAAGGPTSPPAGRVDDVDEDDDALPAASDASAEPALRTTTAPDVFPPDEPAPPARPYPSPGAHTASTSGSAQPPAFPGEIQQPEDPEATILPGDHDVLSRSGRGTDLDRLTHARLCIDGHPNPPHQTSCTTCGLRLDMNAAPVTVEQPVIAVAVLPSGEQIDLSGVLVLGRNPRLEAARCDDAVLVPVSTAPSVSRTHAIIRTEGWSITVTDCGSQGGTALVTPDADDPVPLAAWTPHEVAGGDTIYLGGPTAVRIIDVPG